MAKTHAGIEKLDGYALQELVKAICEGALNKISGGKEEHICIEYDGAGFNPLKVLKTLHFNDLNTMLFYEVSAKGGFPGRSLDNPRFPIAAFQTGQMNAALFSQGALLRGCRRGIFSKSNPTKGFFPFITK